MEFNFKILDEVRNEKGITIEAICKAVDINPSTWWRMVNGSIKKPKFETLARI